MFDATKGQQAADTRLESLSDQLAADAVAFLGDPSIARARKEAALAAAANIFADPDQLGRLAQGTYAQNSAGQPAAQLGAGTTTATPTNAQDGLQAILSDGAVDPGIKSALRRILTPDDPHYLSVDREGTPTELVTTRQQRDTARTERDAARVELLRERDPNRDGSLAKQLAAVTAERDTARAAAGGYNQTAAQAALDAVDQSIEDLVGKMGGRVEGRNELKQQLNALLRAIHLTRA